MRKIIFLVLLFICSTLAVSAQESIRVKFQGAQPTISDFAWAFLSSNDDDEEEDCVDESFNAIRAAWDTHSKGLPQEEGVTLTIDQKNGFVVYEYKSEYEDVKHLTSSLPTTCAASGTVSAVPVSLTVSCSTATTMPPRR